METLLVTPKNSEDLFLLKDFLEKRNISNEILTFEDKEDIRLLKLMNESDRSKYVSEESIFELLDA